ncbi:MAG: hypothetical protein Q8M18_04750, partial [Bradyrhizobium sp.]|nr:hypothetical protein [Bradyrhizobium sp.]
SYKVLPHAFTVADEGMSMLGAAIEGDYRGAMGTAVSVAVEPSATAAAASVFGAIGTGIGATVGSFIPVVGTAGGAMVGGAIGTVAGGYICAVAYDIYVKEWVGKGVEGGIAGMIDVAPQQQAMRTRHEFLYAQAADDLKPHWDRLRAAGFGSGGVELIGPESTPYISIPKPPLPDPQQQAALPGGPSIGPGDIQILAGDTVTNCSIADDKMRCERSWILGLERWHWQFEGTINGSTVVGNDLTVHDVRFQTVNCGYRWRWSYQLRYDFEDGGRVRITASNGAISLVSNTCPVPPKSVLPPSYSGVVTWRARQ